MKMLIKGSIIPVLLIVHLVTKFIVIDNFMSSNTRTTVQTVEKEERQVLIETIKYPLEEAGENTELAYR